MSVVVVMVVVVIVMMVMVVVDDLLLAVLAVVAMMAVMAVLNTLGTNHPPRHAWWGARAHYRRAMAGSSRRITGGLIGTRGHLCG
jgi:hypothetical protein